MNTSSEFSIGEFKVNSGLIVTDPCYQYDEAQILRNVKRGNWEAYVKITDEGAWGKRIAELQVCSSDHFINDYEWEVNRKIEVGVDSGQAGFFDIGHYPTGESTGEYGDLNTFYGKVCEMTVEGDRAGILPFGAVSSSGYGDGGYRLYTIEKNGEIIAAKIVFIDEEDEDDYYDNGEEE